MHYPRFTITLRWLSITLLILAGCQQEEPEMDIDSRFIRFMPSVNETRALPTEKFAKGDKIGLIQYLYVVDETGDKSGTSDWDTKKALIQPSVDFYNQEGTYKEGVIEYENARSWSSVAEDKYTFFAYYPYSGTPNSQNITISNEKKRGAPTLTYTLPYTQKTGDTFDFSTVKDVMVAATFDHQKRFGTVRFNFNHILSCIDFKVNNLNTSNRVRLTSLLLSGSFNPGVTVDMETLGQSPAESTFRKFAFIGNPEIFESTLNSGPVSLGVRNGNYLFIVPTATPKDWKVSIAWEVLNEKGTVLNRHTLSAIPVGGNINFQSGKKHAFTLNFLGDVCTIQSSVTDWETPDNEDNNIEFE